MATTGQYKILKDQIKQYKTIQGNTRKDTIRQYKTI